MTEANRCSDCGSPLPADAEGLCAKCLLRVGMEPERHLHIRCPHCRQPVEIVDDAPLREITCPSCQSSFSFLDDDTVGQEPEVPRRLGQFDLIEQIGIGAFGAVWRAHDSELQRTVAVKIPRKGDLSTAETEQFLREARAAAQLRHPNIVSVHEVGREGQTVYIVSDYVQGANLAEWLSGKSLSPRDAAELCATIAEALHHAHEAGVVHRDLKPSNIMLDGDGGPHVTDFGLAKREAAEMTVTMDGRVLGTPAYMSPEQARGEGHEADRRSDVYSLGVILFELLAGEQPFRGTTRMLLHQVIHDEPPQPRKLNAGVPRELQTICLKCLEKEPRHRYATANELAADLRRHLANEPIVARPAGLITRSIKWARRRPSAAALLCMSVLSAVLVTAGAVSLAGVTTRWYREATNREHAERLLRETEQERREDAEQSAAEQKRLRQLAVTEANKAITENGLKRRHLYAARVALAHQAYQQAYVPTAAGLLRQQSQDGDKDLRSFEWHYLRRMSHQQHLEIDAKCGTVMALAFSADGKTLFSQGADFFKLREWDLASGRQLSSRSGKEGDQLMPDKSTRLVSVSERDRIVRVTDAATGSVIRNFEVDDPGFYLRQAALSPDGQRVVIGTWRIFRYYWFEKLPTGTGAIVNFRIGGSIPTRECVLYDVGTARLLGRISGHYRGISAVAFSPNGKLLATASEDATVRLWDAHTGEPLGVPLWHEEGATAVAFSRDGNLLASGGHDGRIKVWSVDRPAERTLLGPKAEVLDVALSPDGKTIAASGRTIGSDSRGAVWLLDASSGKLQETIVREQTVTSVAFHPKQPLLAWGTWSEKQEQRGGVVTLWDIGKRKVADQIRVDEGWYPVTARFARDGKVLVATFNDHVMLWDTEARKQICEVSCDPGWYQWPVVSPDGHWVAFADWDNGKAHMFSVPGGKTGAKLGTGWGSSRSGNGGKSGGIGENVSRGAFSDDGRLFALPARSTAMGAAGKVEVIDIGSGEVQATLRGQSVDFMCTAFSPDGRTIVTGTRDGTLLFWDPATGEQRMRLDAHREQVSSVEFTPDGKTLISAGWDGAICFHRAGD